MTDRQSIYYYFGLVLLCLMVAGSVVYFVKPRLVTRLTPISEPHVSAESGRQHTGDIAGTTLGIMQKGYAEQPIAQQVETNRNPFLWPGEMQPKKKETGPLTPESVPKLGMIIVGGENRLAFLDQKLVYEGSRFGGFRVEKIAPKSVTLSNAYGKLQLIAPEDHFGPAKVKRVERSSP